MGRDKIGRAKAHQRIGGAMGAPQLPQCEEDHLLPSSSLERLLIPTYRHSLHLLAKKYGCSDAKKSEGT